MINTRCQLSLLVRHSSLWKVGKFRKKVHFVTDPGQHQHPFFWQIPDAAQHGADLPGHRRLPQQLDHRGCGDGRRGDHQLSFGRLDCKAWPEFGQFRILAVVFALLQVSKSMLLIALIK